MSGGTVQINWHDTTPVLTLGFHPLSGEDVVWQLLPIKPPVYQMAFNALTICIANILFNYENFTIVVEGASFPVDDVPKNIRSEFSYDQELEWMFLMMNFELEKERREAESLQALELRERIIGLAVTMSRFYKRRETGC